MPRNQQSMTEANHQNRAPGAGHDDTMAGEDHVWSVTYPRATRRLESAGVSPATMDQGPAGSRRSMGDDGGPAGRWWCQAEIAQALVGQHDRGQDSVTPCDSASGEAPGLSRRAMLQRGAAVTAGALVVGTLGTGCPMLTRAMAATVTPFHERDSVGADLQPRDAIGSILAAMDRYPLVALGERHLLQEIHDVRAALLRHPALPGKITDVVVEFGNALYQNLADRFILGDQPVDPAALTNLWRFTIGGNVLWDAPMYEQFFRTVRAVNWMLPPSRRIRVLLGDPPFDHRKVRGLADKDYVLSMIAQRDAHYAAVVEREVLRKGRRALLIAGSNHLLRGLRGNEGAQGLNAASRLAQRHPGALYVIDPLILPPGTLQDPLLQRARAAVAGWPRPAVATVAGTWLGAATQAAEPWVNSGAYLASTPDGRRYGAQADAILYLGPGAVLTASQADPTLYQCGAYRAELQRLSRVATAIEGQPVDFVADGLRQAEAGPSWFAQYGGSK